MSMIDLQREGYLPSSGVPQLPVTNGLEFYLDASVAASVDTANQKWKNLVASPASGAAQTDYDFMLGANTTAGDADEPLHVGTAGGGHSFAYWNLGGDDYFKLPSNTTFVNSMHKSGAAFTVLLLMASDDSVNFSDLLATYTNPSYSGFRFINENGDLLLRFSNGSGSHLVSARSDAKVFTDISDTKIIGISYDKDGGASGSFFYSNGEYVQVNSSNTFDGNFSASNNDSQYDLHTKEIGNDVCYPIGSKMTTIYTFNRALSKAEMDEIYNHFKNQGRV